MIHTQNDFIKWMVRVENQIKEEADSNSFLQYDKLYKQSNDCNKLYNFVRIFLRQSYHTLNLSNYRLIMSSMYYTI